MDAENSSPGTDLGFRSLTREDLSLLEHWLAEPHVRRWWQHDPAAVEADFGPAINGSDPTRYFVVLEGNRPVGLIQSYRIGDHPDWMRALRVVNADPDAVGIDYLIGEVDSIGRGLGTTMIDRFIDQVWRDYPFALAIVVAVRQDNPRSWRALEKAGFRRIRSGELDSDDPSDTGPNHVYELRRFESPRRAPAPSGI